MTLPASGVISLYDVNVELGLSGSAAISLDDAAVRGLFGLASGAISLSDGYGKQHAWRPTATSVTGVSGGSASPDFVPGGTSAWIDHTATGTVDEQEIVAYTGWGTGSFTGTLYFDYGGSLTDSTLGPESSVGLDINGVNQVKVTSDSSGTPVSLYGTATFSLTSVDLSTLVVTVWATGGRTSPGDGCHGYIYIYDLRLVE